MAVSREVSSGLRLIHSIQELRQALGERREHRQRIGFVPTMGALHAGHGSLIEKAARETDCVVVSIFVNPIQFNDPRDYSDYPRTLAADVAFCGPLGANIIFAPSVEEMYPEPQKTFVEVGEVTEHLCGKFRPGHFRGVATVVLKLFQIVQPDRAYFGEKDAQQLAVIQHMVRDLSVPVEVIGVATARESDGLAMSSRNRFLTGEQRCTAPLLYRALEAARQRIAAGERQLEQIKRGAIAMLERAQIRVEYLEIVDPDSMLPVEKIDGPVRLMAAIWLGSTRLIDNVLAAPVSSR